MVCCYEARASTIWFRSVFMRLWSLHPKYLDTQGLVALWREALLAQKVLSGGTIGYRNHPQLERFKKHPCPKKAIAGYLLGVWDEATRRGYAFDAKKIGAGKTSKKIYVTQGQQKYEFGWLCRKLKKRSPDQYRSVASLKKIQPHPFFRNVPGGIASWERVQP
jgi:Pyrimidine dimer DNA glycosylase